MVSPCSNHTNSDTQLPRKRGEELATRHLRMGSQSCACRAMNDVKQINIVTQSSIALVFKSQKTKNLILIPRTTWTLNLVFPPATWRSWSGPGSPTQMSQAHQLMGLSDTWSIRPGTSWRPLPRPHRTAPAGGHYVRTHCGLNLPFSKRIRKSRFPYKLL